MSKLTAAEPSGRRAPFTVAACRSVCSCLSLLTVAVLLLLAPLSKAQAEPVPDATAISEAADPEPPAPLSESLRGMARADYAAARILYEDGDYAGALTKLRAAHGDSADPRLLWNMAACEKQLRHYASMIGLLERYLAEGTAVVTADERAAASGLIETVKAFVNRLTVAVRPDGAQVFVDGVVVGTAPLAEPLLVDMGRHQLRLEKQGYLPYSSDVDLDGGKSLSLQVTLNPEVHEGTLRIVSDADGVIRVDGKVVGTATWTGTLASGPHNVRITAPGKLVHDGDVLIRDNDTAALHINLRQEPSFAAAQSGGSNAWWWIAGGVVAAGAGVGAYLLLRPGEGSEGPPDYGTWGGFQL